MRSFTDNAGREWRIDIGLKELAALRKLLDGSIIDDPEILHKLGDDTLLQAECLAAVVQMPDDMTVADFFAGLKMEGVIEGMVALFLSLADFATKERAKVMFVAIEEFLKRRTEGKAKLAAMVEDGTLRELVNAAYSEA